MRGLVWFATYVILVVTPAVVAIGVDPFPSPRSARVELSAAFGLIAFALILVQFALVSHVRSMSRPFGTDALVQFHRYMGLTAFALVVAHPLLLNTVGLPWSAWNPLAGSVTARSGSVAFWALAGLVITTLWRRQLGVSYEAWRITHLILSIAVAAAMLVHVLAVDGYSRANPMRITVWGYALAFGAILVGYRLVRPLQLRSHPWTLVENRDEGASVRTLRLRPEGHRGSRSIPDSSSGSSRDGRPSHSRNIPSRSPLRPSGQRRDRSSCRSRRSATGPGTSCRDSQRAHACGWTVPSARSPRQERRGRALY
jgi:predicted ferric reductase